jgi:sodium/proline symporter
VARRAGLYATTFNLLFIPAAYLVGMMGLLIVPDLDNPELAIFQVADAVLPAFALGVVMAAIMAAIMSTADALLLQAGTIASHDLWGRFSRKRASEQTSVNVSRLTILAIAVIGLILAITEPPGVFDIVVFATSVLGAAFVPVYVCAVWWKKANTPGALASIIVGTVAAVTAEVTGSSAKIGFDAMGIGLTCSVIAIVVVSLLTQRSHPVPERVLRAVEETAQVRPVPARLAAGEDPTLSAQRPDVDAPR